MAAEDQVGVRLSGPYYLHTIRRLLRDLHPLFGLESPAVVRVDMSALTFMGPAAMALTLATLSKARAEGLMAPKSVIVAPRSRGMFTYLYRMDFIRVLFEGVAVHDPVERHETTGLRECRHFLSEDECVVAARDLAEALEEKVSTDAMSKNSLYVCLSELTENVFFHAGTKHGGFAVAQPLTHSKEIEVAIVDLGVGIAASLRKNPQYAPDTTDDLMAIKTAIRPTVTATPGRNSGYGLAFTRYLLQINQGHLVVRSGNGYLQDGAHRVERVVADMLPGTLVALRLRTDLPFDSTRAWDLLSKAIERILNDSDAAADPTHD
jgi:anti-sigma regulatory factor (Ser/Thr protein kinase)